MHVSIGCTNWTATSALEANESPIRSTTHEFCRMVGVAIRSHRSNGRLCTKPAMSLPTRNTLAWKWMHRGVFVGPTTPLCLLFLCTAYVAKQQHGSLKRSLSVCRSFHCRSYRTTFAIYRAPLLVCLLPAPAPQTILRKVSYEFF